MVQVVGIFIALAGLSAVFYVLERVFPSLPDQRFWRRDRRKAGSSGLGLSIVKNIMDNHAAEIRAERCADGGARFVLVFPPG